MKKIFPALLCLAVLFSLFTACGTAASADTAAPAQSAPAESPAVPENAAPETSPAPSEAAVPETDAYILPEALPLELLYSSGAGAWGTALTLERDGSFTGEYHDSEMGEQGEGYPHGTVYISSFSGRFSDIEQLDGSTWSMTLASLTFDGEVGSEYIEDEIRCVVSAPAGLTEGETYILRAPETLLEGLSGSLLSWWPDNWQREKLGLDTLGRWCLEYVSDGSGFFEMKAGE